MAEIREVREVPVPVERRRSRPLSLFFMFLLGILCTVAAAVIVLMVLDFHGTITWPAGRVDIGLNYPPASTTDVNTTALNTAPVNTAPVNTAPASTAPANTNPTDNTQ